ncbi:MAG: hypothetical protein LQ348_005438 [Seirophora lacunosa]|nr:MAG: hypothetical protein LQ348_005438 [Seirophora lacunosa]
MTFTPKTPAFEKAIKDSRNLKAKPDNDELLQGKAKYNEWKKVADEGMTHQQAQEKYVQLVNSLKEKYGFEG